MAIVHTLTPIMPTIHLDEVTRSSIVEQGSLTEIRRGFAIDDMDPSLPPGALMIAARDLPGMPTYGDVHPFFANARLVRKEFSGNTVNGVAGQLVYSSDLGLQPTELTITRDTRTVSVTASILPDGTLIGASFNGSDPQAAGDDAARDPSSIPFDTIPGSFRRACTAIIVEGTNFGNPNYAAEDYVDFVNAGVWRGRPSGSWLVDGFTSVHQVYRGITTYRTVLLGAPGKKLWWTTGVLRSQITGRVASYDDMQQDIQNALAKPYKYGQVADEGRGFSVVGAYETVPFAVLGLP